MKKTKPYPKDGTCCGKHGNILHCNGNPAVPFDLLCQDSVIRPVALPRDACKEDKIGSGVHVLPAETFSPLTEKQPQLRITQVICKHQDKSEIYRNSLASSGTIKTSFGILLYEPCVLQIPDIFFYLILRKADRLIL